MNPKFITKCIILLVCIISPVLLVGCWDYLEMEDRGYVLGIAIDKATPLPKGHEPTKEYLNERDIEKMPLQQGSPKYAYTIQIPIIPAAKIKPSGQGGGSGDLTQEKTWDLTIEGNSFFEINREYATRLDYPAFYEHLQAIIISEDVAKEGITPTLDMILRDPEMRRRTRVFITPQDAKSILDVVPNIDDYASMYLKTLPDNARKTSRTLHLTDLGRVAQSIHSKMDFVLPRVVSTKDEIKDAGCAVFKGDKLVGWLGEIDTIYLKWIDNAVLGGIIVIENPMDPEGIVNLEINKVKTKVRPKIQGDHITMDIKTDVTFNVAEKIEKTFVDALDQNFIKKVEDTASKKIKSEMKDTIQYVQKTYGADIFFFGRAMSRYEPDKWDEIKDDWDEIFPTIDTNIEVNVTVKQIGITK